MADFLAQSVLYLLNDLLFCNLGRIAVGMEHNFPCCIKYNYICLIAGREIDRSFQFLFSLNHSEKAILPRGRH